MTSNTQSNEQREALFNELLPELTQVIKDLAPNLLASPNDHLKLQDWKSGEMPMPEGMAETAIQEFLDDGSQYWFKSMYHMTTEFPKSDEEFDLAIKWLSNHGHPLPPIATDRISDLASGKRLPTAKKNFLLKARRNAFLLRIADELEDCGLQRYDSNDSAKPTIFKLLATAWSHATGDIISSASLIKTNSLLRNEEDPIERELRTLREVRERFGELAPELEAEIQKREAKLEEKVKVEKIKKLIPRGRRPFV